ncbi:MAG TPA: hypothetical protein VFH30_00920 [Acidimicrobiales bacterium]|nr:hypothetical protein [Acidimicrobiales bacterium]
MPSDHLPPSPSAGGAARVAGRCPAVGQPALAINERIVDAVLASGTSHEGFIYTPDPGFVGEDSFEYVCLGAANTIGTVFITVTAAPAAPPAPPPAATPVAVSAVTFTG